MSCIILPILGISRIDETMPSETVFSSPRGLPITIIYSPISGRESAIGREVIVWLSIFILSRAISLSLSIFKYLI